MYTEHCRRLLCDFVTKDKTTATETRFSLMKMRLYLEGFFGQENMFQNLLFHFLLFTTAILTSGHLHVNRFLNCLFVSVL